MAKEKWLSNWSDVEIIKAAGIVDNTSTTVASFDSSLNKLIGTIASVSTTIANPNFGKFDSITTGMTNLFTSISKLVEESHKLNKIKGIEDKDTVIKALTIMERSLQEIMTVVDSLVIATDNAKSLKNVEEVASNLTIYAEVLKELSSKYYSMSNSMYFIPKDSKEVTEKLVSIRTGIYAIRQAINGIRTDSLMIGDTKDIKDIKNITKDLVKIETTFVDMVKSYNKIIESLAGVSVDSSNGISEKIIAFTNGIRILGTSSSTISAAANSVSISVDSGSMEKVSGKMLTSGNNINKMIIEYNKVIDKMLNMEDVQTFPKEEDILILKQGLAKLSEINNTTMGLSQNLHIDGIIRIIDALRNFSKTMSELETIVSNKTDYKWTTKLTDYFAAIGRSFVTADSIAKAFGKGADYEYMAQYTIEDAKNIEKAIMSLNKIVSPIIALLRTLTAEEEALAAQAGASSAVSANVNALMLTAIANISHVMSALNELANTAAANGGKIPLKEVERISKDLGRATIILRELIPAYSAFSEVIGNVSSVSVSTGSASQIASTYKALMGTFSALGTDNEVLAATIKSVEKTFAAIWRAISGAGIVQAKETLDRLSALVLSLISFNVPANASGEIHTKFKELADALNIGKIPIPASTDSVGQLTNTNIKEVSTLDKLNASLQVIRSSLHDLMATLMQLSSTSRIFGELTKIYDPNLSAMGDLVSKLEKFFSSISKLRTQISEANIRDKKLGGFKMTETIVRDSISSQIAGIVAASDYLSTISIASIDTNAITTAIINITAIMRIVDSIAIQGSGQSSSSVAFEQLARTAGYIRTAAEALSGIGVVPPTALAAAEAIKGVCNAIVGLEQLSADQPSKKLFKDIQAAFNGMISVFNQPGIEEATARITGLMGAFASLSGISGIQGQIVPVFEAILKAAQATSKGTVATVQTMVKEVSSVVAGSPLANAGKRTPDQIVAEIAAKKKAAEIVASTAGAVVNTDKIKETNKDLNKTEEVLERIIVVAKQGKVNSMMLSQITPGNISSALDKIKESSERTIGASRKMRESYNATWFAITAGARNMITVMDEAIRIKNSLTKYLFTTKPETYIKQSPIQQTTSYMGNIESLEKYKLELDAVSKEEKKSIEIANKLLDTRTAVGKAFSRITEQDNNILKNMNKQIESSKLNIIYIDKTRDALSNLIMEQRKQLAVSKSVSDLMERTSRNRSISSTLEPVYKAEERKMIIPNSIGVNEETILRRFTSVTAEILIIHQNRLKQAGKDYSDLFRKNSSIINDIAELRNQGIAPSDERITSRKNLSDSMANEIRLTGDRVKSEQLLVEKFKVEMENLTIIKNLTKEISDLDKKRAESTDKLSAVIANPGLIKQMNSQELKDLIKIAEQHRIISEKMGSANQKMVNMVSSEDLVQLPQYIQLINSLNTAMKLADKTQSDIAAKRGSNTKSLIDEIRIRQNELSILEKSNSQNRGTDAVLARTIELHNVAGQSVSLLSEKYNNLTSSEILNSKTTGELAGEFKAIADVLHGEINTITNHNREITAQIAKMKDLKSAIKDTADSKDLIKFFDDTILALQQNTITMNIDQEALSKLNSQFSKGASNINTYANSMSTLRAKSASVIDAVGSIGKTIAGEKYTGIGEEPAVMAERFATAQKDVASQIRIVNSLLTTTNNLLINVNKPENTALVKGFAGELTGIQGTLSNRLQQLKEMKVTVDANAQSYALLAGNIESLARIMAKDILPLTTDKKTIWVGNNGGGGAGGTGGGGGGNIPSGSNPDIEKETARLIKLTEARIDAMEAAKANGLATLAEAEEMRLSGVSMQTNIDALNTSSREILKRKLALETMIQVLEREAKAGNISREVMEQLNARMRESVNATGELGSMLKIQAVSFKKFKDSARDAGEEIASTIAMQMRQFTSFTLLFGIMSSVRETFNKIVEESKYLGIALSASRSDVDSLSERLEILHDTMDRMRVKFGTSSEEIGQSLYQMGSAGLNMKDTLASIEPIMNLIVGTGAEANSIAKTMAATFNVLSYQGVLTGNSLMDLGHIADVTAAIFRDNQIEIDEFTNALKYVLPIAHLVGVSFEELSAILGTLHNQGIKAGQAGRSLRSVFFSIAQNREKFERAFADLGIKIDPSGPLRFMDILDQLGDKLGKGAISVARLEQVVTALNMRGTGPFLLLAQGAGLLKQNLVLAKDGADGAAGALAKIKIDMLDRQIKIMNENLFVFSKALVGWFVKGIEFLIRTFNKLAEVIRIFNEVTLGIPAIFVGITGAILGSAAAIAIIRQVFLGIIGLIIYINRTINEFIVTTNLASGSINVETASLYRNTLAKEVNAVATANLNKANTALVSTAPAQAVSGFGTGVVSGAVSGFGGATIGSAAVQGNIFKNLLASIGEQFKSLGRGFQWIGGLIKTHWIIALIAAIAAAVGFTIYLNSTSRALSNFQEKLGETDQLLQDIASSATERIKFETTATSLIENYKKYNAILKSTGSSATEAASAQADLNNVLLQASQNTDIGFMVSVDSIGNLSLEVDELENLISVRKEMAKVESSLYDGRNDQKRIKAINDLGDGLVDIIKKSKELEEKRKSSGLSDDDIKTQQELNKSIIDAIFKIRKADPSFGKQFAKSWQDAVTGINESIDKGILAIKSLKRELSSFGRIDLYDSLIEQSKEYKYAADDLNMSILETEYFLSKIEKKQQDITFDPKKFQYGSSWIASPNQSNTIISSEENNNGAYAMIERLRKEYETPINIPVSFDDTLAKTALLSLQHIRDTMLSMDDIPMNNTQLNELSKLSKLEILPTLNSIKGKLAKGIMPSADEALNLLSITSKWAEKINEIRIQLNLPVMKAWVGEFAGVKKYIDAIGSSLLELLLAGEQQVRWAEAFGRALNKAKTPIFGALAPAYDELSLIESSLRNIAVSYTKQSMGIKGAIYAFYKGIDVEATARSINIKHLAELMAAQVNSQASRHQVTSEMAGDAAALGTDAEKAAGNKYMKEMEKTIIELVTRWSSLNHDVKKTLVDHSVVMTRLLNEQRKVIGVGSNRGDQLEYELALVDQEYSLMLKSAMQVDVDGKKGIAYREALLKFDTEILAKRHELASIDREIGVGYMESVGKLMDVAEGQRSMVGVAKDIIIIYDKWYNVGQSMNELETRHAQLLKDIRRGTIVDVKDIFAYNRSMQDYDKQRIDLATEYLGKLREMRGMIEEINNLYKEFLGIQKDAVQSMAAVYEERLSRVSDAFSKIIESMASNSPSSFAIKTAVAMGSLEGITMDTSDAIQEMVKELEEGSIQSGLMGVLFGNSIGGMSKKIFELTNIIKQLGKEEAEITKKMAAFDINILNQILGKGIDKMTMEDLGRAKESLASLLGYSKEFAKVDPDSALELYRSIALIAGEMAELTLKQKDEVILRMGLDPTDFYRTLDEMTKKMETFIDMVSKKYGGLTIQAYGIDGSKIDIKGLVLTTLQGLLSELLDKKFVLGTTVQPAQNTGNRVGYASGGRVPGGSSAQGDIIPAMLTPGEFVIPADVVSRVGVGNFMNLISGGHGVMKFAEGGYVGDVSQISSSNEGFIELMRLMDRTVSNLMRTVDKLSPSGIGSSGDPRWGMTDTAHITSSQFEMAISKVIDLVTLQQQLIATYKLEQERVSGNTESITSLLKKITFGSSIAQGETSPIVSPVVERTIDLSSQFKPFLSNFNNILDDFIINLTGVLSRGISIAPTLGYASGGSVPGSGTGDTVPAMLTPGEFVIPADVVSRIGADKLYKLIHGTGLTDADYQELLGIFDESRIGNRTLAKGLRRNKMSFYDYLNSQEDAGYDLYTKIRDFAQEKHVTGFNKGGLVGGVQYMQEGGIASSMSSDEKRYLFSSIDLYIDDSGTIMSRKLLGEQFIKIVEGTMDEIAHMFDPVPSAIIQKLVPLKVDFEELAFRPIQTALMISNQYPSNPEKLETAKLEPELLQPIKFDQEDISKSGDLLGERFAGSVDRFLSDFIIVSSTGKKSEEPSPLDFMSIEEAIKSYNEKFSESVGEILPKLDAVSSMSPTIKINSEEITKASNELNNMKDILGKLNINAMSNFETQWRKLLNQSIIRPYFAVLTKMRTAWKDEWTNMLDTTLPLIARFMPMIGQAIIDGIVGAISGLPEIFNSVLGEVMDMSWIPFDNKLVDDTAKTMQDIKDSYEDGLEALVKQLRRNEISYLDYLNNLEDLQDKYLDDVAKANEDAAATTEGEDFFAQRVDQIVQAIAAGFSSVASSFASTLQSAITEALKTGAENSLTDLKGIFLTAGAALFSLDFGTNKRELEKESMLFKDIIWASGGVVTAFSDTIGVVLGLSTAVASFGGMLAGLTREGVGTFFGGKEGVGGVSDLPSIYETIDGVVSRFVTEIPTVMTMIATNAGPLIAKLSEGLKVVIPIIMDAAKQFVQILIDNLPAIVEGLTSALSGIIEGVVAMMPQLAELLGGLVRGLLDVIINSLIANFANIINGLLLMVVSVIDAILSKLGDIIGSLIEQIPGIIVALVNAAANIVVSIARNIPKIITSLISHLPKIIFEIIKAIPQIIWAIISHIPQIAFEFVKALVSSLADMLGDIPILGDVLGGLSDGIEWLGDAASDLGDALSSIFGSDKVTKQQTYKELLAKRSGDSNVSLDLTAMKEILRTQGIDALASRLISMASMGQLTVDQLEAVRQLLSDEELEAAGLAKLGLRVNTDQLTRLTEMVKYLEEISSNTTPEQQKIYYDQALAAAPAIRQEWLGTVDSSGNRGMIGTEIVSDETLASMISTLQALNVSNDKIQEMVVSFSQSSAAMGLSAEDSQKAWELLQTQASQTGLTGDALAAVMKLAIAEQQTIAALEATGQNITEAPLDYFLKEYQKLLQEYLQPQYGLSAEEARSRAASEASMASMAYWSNQTQAMQPWLEAGAVLAEKSGSSEDQARAQELIDMFNSLPEPLAGAVIELFEIYNNLKTLNAETAAAAAEASASSDSGTSGTSQGPEDWHTGGIVYAHRGFLAKDEVPAVLLTGEGVLNREAMKAIGEDNFRLLNAGVSLEQIMEAATKKYVDVSTGASTGLPPVIHNDSSSQDNSSNQSTEINNHSEDNRTVVQFNNCSFNRNISQEEIEDNIVSNYRNRNGQLQAVIRNKSDNKTSRH